MPSKRIREEKRTVDAMIRLHCAHHHAPRDGLCIECADLAAFAFDRLDRCPFGAGKTTCARCPVHCYQPDQRVRIRQVMRYAGPRMLWRHPLMALRHALAGMRSRPVAPPKG